MATPLYSTEIFEAFFLGTGVTLAGEPAINELWVIRDIDLTTGGEFPLTFLTGLSVYGTGGAPFCSIQPPQALTGMSYSWRGRQIIEQGQGLLLFTEDETWAVRISGYVLSTI
jgi:hypothetical protein